MFVDSRDVKLLFIIDYDVDRQPSDGGQPYLSLRAMGLGDGGDGLPIDGYFMLLKAVSCLSECIWDLLYI